ncbi:MAG: hypothetical protein JSS67_11250 [Bacteroidetes bacterium]|nr:hypothetical protein [Bacteroidota bacterium]
MKTKLTLVLLVCLCKLSVAQNNWFATYSDSTAMITDANKEIQKLADRIHKNYPSIDLHKNIAIKNTKPTLISINNETVNIPFWAEVIVPQKKFFTELAGGEIEGDEVFGLFFNGFYLAHELGHSYFSNTGKKFDNNYDSEYEANTFAILYWKTIGESMNLKKCYDYSLKMLKALENPIPQKEDFKKYITENYDKLASDPYKYGFIQFSQFVEIYEKTNLPDFDTYIKTHK